MKQAQTHVTVLNHGIINPSIILVDNFELTRMPLNASSWTNCNMIGHRIILSVVPPHRWLIYKYERRALIVEEDWMSETFIPTLLNKRDVIQYLIWLFCIIWRCWCVFLKKPGWCLVHSWAFHMIRDSWHTSRSTNANKTWKINRNLYQIL